MLTVREMRRILLQGNSLAVVYIRETWVTSYLIRSGFKQNAEASFTEIFCLELLLEGVVSKIQDLIECYLSSIEYQLGTYYELCLKN